MRKWAYYVTYTDISKCIINDDMINVNIIKSNYHEHTNKAYEYSKFDVNEIRQLMRLDLSFIDRQSLREDCLLGRIRQQYIFEAINLSFSFEHIISGLLNAINMPLKSGILTSVLLLKPMVCHNDDDNFTFLWPDFLFVLNFESQSVLVNVGLIGEDIEPDKYYSFAYASSYEIRKAEYIMNTSEFICRYYFEDALQMYLSKTSKDFNFCNSQKLFEIVATRSISRKNMLIDNRLFRLYLLSLNQYAWIASKSTTYEKHMKKSIAFAIEYYMFVTSIDLFLHLLNENSLYNHEKICIICNYIRNLSFFNEITFDASIKQLIINNGICDDEAIRGKINNILGNVGTLFGKTINAVMESQK